MWKFITKGWEKFRECVQFQVGDGNRISFWIDFWCGDTSLCLTYPELYQISLDKDGTVTDSVALVNGQRVWNPRFRRNFHDGRWSRWMNFLECWQTPPCLVKDLIV